MADETNRNVEEIVSQAIAETFPHHRAPVTAETSARVVPGWDSLSHVDLMLLIEQKLSRKIDVAQTFRLKNVGELVAFLKALA